MPKISGITIERTYKGVPKFVTIDLRKHADIIPILEEKGILEKPRIPNATTLKAIKEAMDGKKLKTYNSVDELFKHWEDELQD